MKTLRLISSALKDRYLQTHQPKMLGDGYAFLVHPRHIQDVCRKYPFFSILPVSVTIKILKYLWPITVSEITGVYRSDAGEAVRGWIISTIWTPDMMMSDREGAKQHIIKAARLAESRGAKIIGLGGLTASLTNGGEALLPHLRGSVTTGRVFTAKIVADIACDAAKLLRLDVNANVAILGAAGSIGSAVAQILVSRGFKNIILIDVGKRQERLEKLRDLLCKKASGINVQLVYELNILKTADVIVAATNRPDALIRSEHVRSGAIIVDDAQPSDVSAEVRDRKDVLVFQGGVVHAPGVNVHFNIGLQHREDIYSCLAEVVLLASINHQGHHMVGEIFELDFNSLEKLSKIGDELGFKSGEFQSNSKTYTAADIDSVIAARWRV